MTADVPYGQAKQAILAMISNLPFITPKQLQRVFGLQGDSSLNRHLIALRDEGLINDITAAAPDGRPPTRLYLTDRGLAAAARFQRQDVRGLVRRLGLSRNGLLKLIPKLPLLDAAYDLLGSVMRSGTGCPELWVCQRPFWRSYRPRLGRTKTTVQLPLGVTVAWDGRFKLECLLLPDAGIVSPHHHRLLVSKLMELRQVLYGHLPVLVVMTQAGRKQAWSTVIQAEAARRGEPRLEAVIVSTTSVDEQLRQQLASWMEQVVPGQKKDVVALPVLGEDPKPTHILGDRLELDDLSTRLLQLVPTERRGLWLVGRSAGITEQDLNLLEDRPEYEHRKRLFGRGFLKTKVMTTRPLDGKEVRPFDTLALTSDGFAAVAGQSVLPTWQVRRQLVDGDYVAREVRRKHESSVRPQQRKKKRQRQNAIDVHPFHMLGAIWPITNLLRRAKENRQAKGWDDAVIDWQSEVFAYHGSLRPDGYVQYQHWGDIYAAFIEFDCGTVNDLQ